MPALNARIALLAALTTAPIFFAPPAWALEAPADPAKLPAQLEALERKLEQTESERDRLQSQLSTSARALGAVRADMIATAKDIQDLERSLTVLESNIARLEDDGRRLTQTLGRRDAQMVEVLMALERLALRPSDALALSPLSPSDAVRSAILLRSALPSIRQSSATLQGELKELYRVRAEITERREQAAAGAAALLQKQTWLTSLARERAEKYEILVARGEVAEQRTAKIAREAEDLRALFARLAEEKARRDEADRKLATARAQERAKEKLAAEKLATDKLAAEKLAAEKAGAGGAETQLAGLPRVEPTPSPAPLGQKPAGGNEESVTRSFTQARGTMPFPVAGSLTGRYGAASQAAGEAGLLAKGITITGRAGAQVVAPYDGVIAFAGPFRGYGQLLIIEHSEGYHTLLAGMGQIDATVGQRVLAGEPIGIMASEGASALYVELRRDGQPINPLPWLADRAGKNSG